MSDAAKATQAVIGLNKFKDGGRNSIVTANTMRFSAVRFYSILNESTGLPPIPVYLAIKTPVGLLTTIHSLDILEHLC